MGLQVYALHQDAMRLRWWVRHGGGSTSPTKREWSTFDMRPAASLAVALRPRTERAQNDGLPEAMPELLDARARNGHLARQPRPSVPDPGYAELRMAPGYAEFATMGLSGNNTK